MSVQAIAWAFKQDIPDAAAKFLLVTLSNYADEHGRCYPSVRRLAKDTSQSVRTVQRKLRQLEQEGWLITEERYTALGDRGTNTYWLAVKGRFSSPVDDGSEHNPWGDDPATPPSASAAPPCAVRGTTVEPSENQQGNLPSQEVRLNSGGLAYTTPTREGDQTTGWYNRAVSWEVF